MESRSTREKADAVERKILWFLAQNAEIKQEELARKIGITQPAVCFRLKKMKEEGLICKIVGLNIKKIKLTAAVIKARTQKLNFENPYLTVLFKTSQGIFALLVAEDKKTLSFVARKCFDNPKIYFVEDIEGFLPLRIRVTKNPPVDCSKCEFYAKGCLGLPGTPWYRGSFWRA